MCMLNNIHATFTCTNRDLSVLSTFNLFFTMLFISTILPNGAVNIPSLWFKYYNNLVGIMAFLHMATVISLCWLIITVYH